MSGGFLLAAADVSREVRPRRVVRERRPLVLQLSLSSIVVGLAIGALGVAAAQHLRMSLGPTCLGAAALLAFATWLMLVEEDDDGETLPEGPDWWPDFEREFRHWSRKHRIPTGPRS